MEDKEFNEMKETVDEICSSMKMSKSKLLYLLMDPEHKNVRAIFEENGFSEEGQEHLMNAITYILYEEMIEREFFKRTVEMVFNNNELVDLAQKLGFFDNEDGQQ